MSVEKREMLAKEAYIMMHPLRYKIVKALSGKGRMYIAQIAREIGMPDKRKLVAFHLNVLGQYGLVDSEYGMRGGPPTDKTGRPIVVNYYKLSEKAEEVVSTFDL